MSTKIGLLTEVQVRNLELRGIEPDHKFVEFWKPEDVLLLIEARHPKFKDREARWVAPDRYLYRYAFLLPAKKWQPVGGVLQLVNGVVGGGNSGAGSAISKSRGSSSRYAIEAAGAHERRTSVAANNGTTQDWALEELAPRTQRRRSTPA